MSRQWFCGITKSGRETLAKRELQNQDFETYLPLCIREWSKKPKILVFLPSYIFIRLDSKVERWRAIYSTFGMRTLLFSGDKPSPIPDWVIDEIQTREVDGLVRLPPPIHCRYKRGDTVGMKGSPLQVVFDEAVDHKRAAILIRMLGRGDHRQIVPIARLYSIPLAATG